MGILAECPICHTKQGAKAGCADVARQRIRAREVWGKTRGGVVDPGACQRVELFDIHRKWQSNPKFREFLQSGQARGHRSDDLGKVHYIVWGEIKAFTRN